MNATTTTNTSSQAANQRSRQPTMASSALECVFSHSIFPPRLTVRRCVCVWVCVCVWALSLLLQLCAYAATFVVEPLPAKTTYTYVLFNVYAVWFWINKTEWERITHTNTRRKYRQAGITHAFAGIVCDVCVYIVRSFVFSLATTNAMPAECILRLRLASSFCCCCRQWPRAWGRYSPLFFCTHTLPV